MPKGAVGPGGLSANSYVEKCLRQLDADNFSAAGIIPFRKVEGGVEVLLTWETPWNSFTQANDPKSLNVFGGKKIPRQERTADVTAVRTFLDAVGIVKGIPEPEALYKLIFDGFVLWFAFGKFALLFADVTDHLPADLAEQFVEARKETPLEEFKITPTGIKTWIKQIEAVEWVSGSSLIPEPKTECSDLLQNMMQVEMFRDFLEGKLDYTEAFPPAAEGEMPPALRPFDPASKGKGGKSKGGKGKGFNGGGGKGFGGKGFGGKGFGGKDFGMKGMKGMVPFGIPDGKGGMMAPMMPMMMPYNEQPQEMQQGMYGEQLYVLVKPLSPSAYMAQKITGMLLELPHNELMMNLKNHEELERRVQEALVLLTEDGLVS